MLYHLPGISAVYRFLPAHVGWVGDTLPHASAALSYFDSKEWERL